MNKRSITDYFRKKNVEEDETNTEHASSTVPPKKVARTYENISEIEPNNNLEKNAPKDVPNDISKFRTNGVLTDFQKYEVLTNAWYPDSTFKFPVAENRNLKFQLSWLGAFPWLTYSPSENGVYCRYCLLFSTKLVGAASSQSTGFFVQTCFRNWKKAIEKYKEHQTKKYHLNAMEAAEDFKNVYERKRLDIACEIERGRNTQKEANRQKLLPIAEAIIFLGRQGLALRGHRDTGPLSLDMPLENDGNFRAIIRYAVQNGNKELENHLKNAPANATYISPHIQNEMVDAAGGVIRSKIVQQVNRSKCFTVIADETTDVSGMEQLSICARYVHENQGRFVFREEFLTFVVVDDVTGKGLAETLLSTMKGLGLNLNYLKGQGYDGASCMKGERNGCAAIIRKTYPEALYVHCANHSLNLTLMHACKVAVICNCIAAVKDVVKYFRKSNKAAKILKDHITSACPEAKQTRLLKFCETRWVEHLNSLSLFFETYEHICSALYEIGNESYGEEANKANSMLHLMQNSGFIFALVTLRPVFSMIKSLALYLQKESCDLSCCVAYASNLKGQFESMRLNSVIESLKQFKDAQLLAQKANVELKPPIRLKSDCKYQNNVEDYFRRFIYLPFLDHLIKEIERMFEDHEHLFNKIQNIIPNKTALLEQGQIRATAEVMQKQWPSEVHAGIDEFEAELAMWTRRWAKTKEEDRPSSFIETLEKCDKIFYPTVSRFLRIGATLPVSNASSERSFSSLRRLKTYLRNKTGEDRLNGLAQLNIHRDIEVSADEILSKMCESSRKLGFVL